MQTKEQIRTELMTRLTTGLEGFTDIEFADFVQCFTWYKMCDTDECEKLANQYDECVYQELRETE